MIESEIESAIESTMESAMDSTIAMEDAVQQSTDELKFKIQRLLCLPDALELDRRCN